MSRLADQLVIEHNALIPTWFRVGGCADRLVRPSDLDELCACVELDPSLVVLGDGANLLVDDDGLDTLVVALSSPAFTAKSSAQEQNDGTVRITVGAGVRLPRLINDTVAAGLGGLEGLAGIPASLGGAVRMNAGGAFGEIADSVVAVHGISPEARTIRLERGQIDFRYRHSGLEDVIITGVELCVRPGSIDDLKRRRLEVMQHKASTQPLDAKSAGCCFKNPVLRHDLDGLGAAGERVAAGLLIDRAGGKSMAFGGASVSELHANFVVTTPEAKARDVIQLMELVKRRVDERFNVELEREVVVWARQRAKR